MASQIPQDTLCAFAGARLAASNRQDDQTYVLRAQSVYGPVMRPENVETILARMPICDTITSVVRFHTLEDWYGKNGKSSEGKHESGDTAFDNAGQIFWCQNMESAVLVVHDVFEIG